MKRNIYFKLVLFVLIATFPSAMINRNDCVLEIKHSITNPLYSNVWGTIYHAEKRQCDDSPTITGDGSLINPNKASNHRWIAITQFMLKDEWRRSLALKKDSSDTRFNGKIQYGDTIWIESPCDDINGWWIVHDTKNKRYEDLTIDFLQTKDDGSLYNYNPKWCGRFNDIKIYSAHDAKLLGLNMRT